MIIRLGPVYIITGYALEELWDYLRMYWNLWQFVHCSTFHENEFESHLSSVSQCQECVISCAMSFLPQVILQIRKQPSIIKALQTDLPEGFFTMSAARWWMLSEKYVSTIPINGLGLFVTGLLPGVRVWLNKELENINFFFTFLKTELQ